MGRIPVDYSGTTHDSIEFLRSRGVQRKDGGGYLWLCKCLRCGGEFQCVPSQVRNAGQVSCGCYRRSVMQSTREKTHAIASTRRERLQAMRDEGMSITQIANVEGVSKQRVSQILTGRER